MADFINSPRRKTGAIFLGISVVMVILGFTIFDKRLTGVRYILYWTICFAFTISAASVALLDIVTVKQRSREEQRDLIEETLLEIEREKRQKNRGNEEQGN